MPSETIRIYEPGEYGPYYFSGDITKSQAIIVNQKVKGKIIIKPSIIENAFVPVTIQQAYDVTFKELNLDSFGGDAIDIWSSDKRLVIKKLFAINNKPVRPYKFYHPDLLQIDNLGSGKVIRGIRIPSIEAYLNGPKTQGIMASGSGIIDDCQFGTEKFWIVLDGYPHVVSAFQMSNCIIGGKDTYVNGDVLIRRILHRNKHLSSRLKLVGVDLNKHSSKIANIVHT